LLYLAHANFAAQNAPRGRRISAEAQSHLVLADTKCPLIRCGFSENNEEWHVVNYEAAAKAAMAANWAQAPRR